MKEFSDHFTKMAREKGYPARSVFKLEEMQAKYHIIRKGDIILDIGAAPGSWSLYALKQIGKTGRVLGIDLEQMKLPEAYEAFFSFVRGDIFSETIIRVLIEQGPYTVILSDAAPSTTGDRIVDTARSFEITQQVFTIALEALAKKGNLVIKIFQGGDEKELYGRMIRSFSRVKAFKPRASKKASMELYYIGFGFMGNRYDNMK
jgi:23S rRNA (uridine2552-2'-O)-methyltransferase